MKKFWIIALAALLVVAFTMPAAALENIFGGYWRTRFISQQDFSGTSDEKKDIQRVDSRTRLYYTAKINDNLKLVNKFEFNAVYGSGSNGLWDPDAHGTNTPFTGRNLKDGADYGDVGADSATFLIKNSYADFTLGPVNVKLGTQGFVLARGFIYDNDLSGATISFNVADNITLPVVWMRGDEGGTGVWNDDGDVDTLAFAPVFSIGENISLNPYLVYYFGDDWDLDAGATGTKGAGPVTDDGFDVYWIGFDVDGSFDRFSFWGSFIYNGGEWEDQLDQEAYLLALGGSVKLGPTDIHGQIMYATGDDPNTTENEGFSAPAASPSHYWAEIMGLGTFDQQGVVWGDFITDIIAFNIGVSFKPMEKMTIGIDLWDASFEDDTGIAEAHVGTEIDLSLKYQLVEGLNLDVVAAYLSADDGLAAVDQEDPIELGARLSLSF